MSLALVVVLGGATILFHSPRFIMLKPSIIHLSIGAVMLRRGWMRRYLPPIAQQYLGHTVIDTAGYAWAALLASIALANVFIALECSLATWAWFISFGAFGAKAVAFGLQYVIFRAVITRRIAVAAAAAAPTPPEAVSDAGAGAAP